MMTARSRSRRGYRRAEVQAAAFASLIVGMIGGGAAAALLAPGLGTSVGQAGAERVLQAASAAFPEAYRDRAEVALSRGVDGELRLRLVRMFIPARRFADDLAPLSPLTGGFQRLGEDFAVESRIERRELTARANRLGRAMAPEGMGACVDYVLSEPRRIEEPGWDDRSVRQLSLTFDFDC